MKPRELADRIEQRACDPKAPPFDDLIEENWKLIVEALRTADDLELVAEFRDGVDAFGGRHP